VAKKNGVPRATRASATGETGWPLRLASRIARSKIGLLRRFQRLFDAPGFCSDGVAEVAEHVLEQHADHQLVFDDEDPLGLRGAFGCHPSTPPLEPARIQIGAV